MMYSELWFGLLPIFMEWALPLLATILGLLGTWVLTQLGSRLGLDIEQRHRVAFQVALDNAAALLVRKMMEKPGGTTTTGALPTVASPEVKTAVDYVQAAVPDAVQFFGINPDAIGVRILSKATQLIFRSR